MADESRLFVALYVDEDITNELAPALRECGFDAISVFDAGRLGMDDAAQLAWAAENRSALMTCNTGDFYGRQKHMPTPRRHMLGSASHLNNTVAGNLVNCFVRRWSFSSL